MSSRIAALRLPQLVARAALNSTAANLTTIPNSTSIGQFATSLNGVNQTMNDLFKDMIWWSLGGLGLLILVMRIWERYSKHSRHLAAMNTPAAHQSYWALNRSNWWKVKKYLLYAPIWKKRHNREIKLSSAVNIGTLPSRLHLILLSIYVLSNLIYCAWLDYTRIDKYSVVAELRGRTGSLAVGNMIPLVIMAGRNNPLISLLQISFDTYNLLHRWMGRIVVIETVAHTAAWAYVKYEAVGWSGVGSSLATDPFLTWGGVGTAALVLMLLSSPSPVRHAFYETFLNFHILLAMAAIIGVLVHCDLGKLPQAPIITALILLWFADRFARLIRILWYNYSSKNWTEAMIVPLPGDACRVTLRLPRYVDIKPGTHAYLRFATLNVWESHPFSIAWIEHNFSYKPASSIGEAVESQESKVQRIDKSKSTTNVSFVIHAHTGMTKRLFDEATIAIPRQLILKAAFEGPYAGHHSLDSYGHCVLFAGSSGITHQIPYIRHLITGYTDGIVATRKILLVWIIRDSEHLEWVRPWMDKILQMPARRDILTIKIFITRPKNPKEVQSPSAKVQMFPGRPNVNQILKAEVRAQVGAMAVTVCGPGGLADNVREVVREVQEEGVVDFVEESFTW